MLVCWPGVGVAIQLTLPSQPVRAARWQPILWINLSRLEKRKCNYTTANENTSPAQLSTQCVENLYIKISFSKTTCLKDIWESKGFATLFGQLSRQCRDNFYGVLGTLITMYFVLMRLPIFHYNLWKQYDLVSSVLTQLCWNAVAGFIIYCERIGNHIRLIVGEGCGAAGWCHGC